MAPVWCIVTNLWRETVVIIVLWSIATGEYTWNKTGYFLITSENVWWPSFILTESSKYLALSPSSYIQIIVLFPFHLCLIVSFYHCISHVSFPGLHPYLSTSNRPQSQTEHERANFSAAVLSTCFSVRAIQCSCFTVTDSMISICGMPLLASQVFDWKYTAEIWCNYQHCYSFLPNTDKHVFVAFLINSV